MWKKAIEADSNVLVYSKPFWNDAFCEKEVFLEKKESFRSKMREFCCFDKIVVIVKFRREKAISVHR